MQSPASPPLPAASAIEFSDFGIHQFLNLGNPSATIDTPFLKFGEVTPVVLPEPNKLVFGTSETFTRKTGYYIVLANEVFNYFKIEIPTEYGGHLFKFTKAPPVLREGFVVISKDIYFVTIQDLKRGLVRRSRKLNLRHGTITYQDFLTGNLGVTPKKQLIKEDINGVSTSESKVQGGPGDHTGNSSSENGKTGQEAAGAAGTDSSKVSDIPVSNIPVADILAAGNAKNNPTVRRSNTPGMDESEVINLAFKEQVLSLLDIVSEKEGNSWQEWEVEEAP